MSMKHKGCKKLAALSAAAVLFLSAGGGLLPFSGTSTAAPAIVAQAADSDFEIDSSGTLTKYTGGGGDVVIPDGVKAIGNLAFSSLLYDSDGMPYHVGCKGLVGITIPHSVTSIGDDAFNSCYNLTDVVIPDSVTHIGKSAFSGCKSITRLDLPDSITRIEDSTFGGCSGIQRLDLPESVTDIGYSAFAWCTGLTQLRLPDSLKNIGICAFYSCRSLTEIVIPDSVETINGNAFSECDRLVTAVIGNSVTSIGTYAFLGCNDLANAYIPASVVTIGRGAFSDSYRLRNVYYGGTEREWKALTTDAYGDKLDHGFTYNAQFYYDVTDIPRITRHPADVSVRPGDSVTFSVAAEGDGLKYQWYYRKAGNYEWNLWKGHTSASWTVVSNATWNGMQVYCGITDRNGIQVSSGISRVTVTQELKILSQPQNDTVRSGESVSFTVKAEGIDLKYQWYYKKSGQTAWNVWKGHTHSSETATVNDTWDGTDSAGNSVESDPATITLSGLLIVTQQPTSQTIDLGKPLTISLKATGSGLTYQWYYKKANQTSWSVWKNRTHASETCTPNTTWNGIQLYCKITDNSGNTMDSDTIKITVVEKITVELQPQTLHVNAGAVVTFSVKASGSGLSYQWYFKKAGQTSWSIWKGHITATTTATANSTWDGMNVCCTVTDSSGNTMTYNAPQIKIK